MLAPIILASLWVWARIEQFFTRHNLASYKPVPIPSTCAYYSSQVSVIVCTVDTLLARCIHAWLANDPLEIIIVTIPQHVDHICSVVANAKLSSTDSAKIAVLSSPVKGKRVQMCIGIQAARGSILATVDDHINWHPDFLKGMLPCFEDARVGAVGPTIKITIRENRRDADVITPWEVAAVRTCWNRNRQLKAAYAAGRWCWVLAGVTGVFRAEILKDPIFLQDFVNDSWNGKKLDVGEDTFITRWLQLHDWVIAIQELTPETVIYRTAKKTPDFFQQMFRWERSTIQSHVRQAFQIRQTYDSIYVARKTWGRLLRPLITTLHIVSWIFCLWSCPTFALLFLILYVGEAARSYREFFSKQPYMLRYWWAAVGQDFFYIIQDYWCWCTLGNTSWEARTVSAEEQNKIE